MARSRGGRAGGIAGLVALIEWHGEALDADLQHYYPGRSLADLVTGRMTFRQLHVLIKGLPGDGTAMWRAGRKNLPDDVEASGPPDDFWTPDRDLLASVIDGQNLLIWLKTEDARKGRNRPKPITRPGVKSPTMQDATPMSAAELLAILRPEQSRPSDKTT